MTVQYEELYKRLEKLGGYDLEKINRAYNLAERCHEGQLRISGEPYIIHPIAVAKICAELQLDTDSICAAFLHDTIEDCPDKANLQMIKKEFGSDVAEIVDGVTKLKIPFVTKQDESIENLRKMFLAMSKDLRVIFIKLADRLHNMRTLNYRSAEKQRSGALETMHVYAPRAHRLGMQKIKWELEDTSLKYLDPVGYNDIMTYLDAHQAEADRFMKEIQTTITTRLSSVGIHGTIYGRIKHVYSIYRKMKAQNKTIDELYDMYAFRVIVDSIPDCYNVLGHIHDLFNLVPGRFKDYISTPKPNMYQSLHTTVIGHQGIPFEVQIRTWEMHETAEYGIAAHWKYKQGVAGGDEKEFEWVRRLLESQQEENDAEDYIHSLKVDMFDDEVFVFTPKGKVMSLPSGSTPIDFAYAIHSGVGNAMVGAKVNNRIASFDQPLRNGDIVEILTSKTAKGPSRDWLNICNSNQARTKIKQWFKKEKREENVAHGKASFEGELRRGGVNPALVQAPELLPTLLRKLAFDSLDDMYAAIGYGGLTAAKAFGRVRDELTRASRQTAAKEPPKQAETVKSRHKDSGVTVEDIDSCMIKFSRCCTPVPGDDIIGFITRGYGVSVHRKDCRNAAGANDPKQKGRWVQVHWNTAEDKPFSTTFEIDSEDRSGLWMDIATALSTAKVKVSEISAREMPAGKARTVATFEVKNVQELESIRTKIRAIPGVTDVRRGQD